MKPAEPWDEKVRPDRGGRPAPRGDGWARVKRWLIARSIEGAVLGARRLPHPLLCRAGAALGDAVYAGSSRFRTTALRNLRQVYGEVWTEEQIRNVARETFRNVGKSALEFLHMPSLSADEVRRLAVIEGREHLDRARERGRGCLLLTAHMGNWELMGMRAVLDGYPLSVLSREADDPGMARLVAGIRHRCGYRSLPRDRGLRPSLEVLRRNEFLGILLDQNYTTGIFVPFFGRLAATASGAAALARTTGAAVLPCFDVRQPDDTHRILVRPALDLRFTEDRETDLYTATLTMTRAIEAAIEAHPAQWLWFHNRWKHRPLGEE